MNDNILESVEWHKDQLEKLMTEDEFGKVESELDGIIEKFRLKGSKDKNKRKTKKSIKDIVSDAFRSKDKKDKKPDIDVTAPPVDADAKIRNLKRAQKHHPRGY